MKLIIYSEIFEPITVVELPYKYLEMLEKGMTLQLAVPPTSIEENKKIRTVNVEPKQVTIDNKTRTLAITKNEELALLLKPTILPGQQTVRLTQK